MDELNLINNTSVYRNPAPQSPLQGVGVMQPAAVYSKIMLRTVELAESDFVFDGLAVERNMPSNNGSNEIVFKRMLSLAAHTQPLVEGIPPASDQGRMVAIKATTNQYGRVMKFTDKVNWAVIDPLISEYTRQLALKIPETKDILAQEALLAECQMYYAAPKSKENANGDGDVIITTGDNPTHIRYMTPDCMPTIDEFRRIVLQMEAAKVRPYQGNNFLVLASSATLFDLITDKRVKEFMKWEGTARAYTNDMVIDLFSLAFKKAKTIKSDNTYINEDGETCHLYHNKSDGKNYVTVGEATEGKSAIVAKAGEEDATVSALTKEQVKALEPLNCHYAFVLGEECLFRIGVEGHTQPQFIKKELGSAGTEDPLNQRQSIGWKIDSLGYKVPNPDAVVAYVSCPSQYKINMNARPDLKNQFTQYNYGYRGEDGNYYHPEQVVQAGTKTIKVNDKDVTVAAYYVRGTAIPVEPVTMTELVKPINGGKLDSTTGKKHVVVGKTPTAAYALASNHEVRFTADQVTKTGDKWHIIGVEAAEVIPLPASFNVTVPKADGSEMETVVAVDEGISSYNLTGDPIVDAELYKGNKV